MQRGFAPEYLLNVDLITKRFMMQSMIVQVEEENKQWGASK